MTGRLVTGLGPDRVATTAFLAGALAVEAAVGVALGQATLPPAAVVGVLALLGVVAACVLAPWQTLLVLAGVWAPAHLLFSNLSLGTGGPLELNLSRALGAVVVVGFGTSLVVRAATGRDNTRLPDALVALVGFLGLLAAATAVSGTGSLAFADLLRVSGAVVVAVAAFRLVSTEERLKTLARVVVLSGVVVAVVSLAQFVLVQLAPSLAAAIFGTGFFEESHDAGRSGSAVRVLGLLGGPFATAGVLLAAAAFALLRFGLLRDAGRARGAALAFLVIAAGLVATLTRAAVVALAVLVLLWVSQRQLRSLPPASLRIRALLAVLLAAVLLAPLAGTETVQARLWDVNPASSGSSFAQGRGEIWSERLNLLASSGPLELAVGQGAHSSYSREAEGGAQARDLSPHNVVLWLLLETGVIGLVLFGLFLAGLFRAFRRAARESRYTTVGIAGAVGLSALAAFVVQDMFHLSVNAPAHGWYFMLLFGALLRAARGFR